MSKSNQLQLCSLSIMGGFFFWSFFGVLTSILAIKKYNIPVQSFEDMKDNDDFRLHIYPNGSIHSMFNKWANDSNYPWKKQAMEKVVNPNFHLNDNLTYLMDLIESEENIAFMSEEDLLLYKLKLGEYFPPKWPLAK